MPRSDRAFALACDQYARLGVRIESALKTLASIPLSLHCWQGDDITGYEPARAGGAQGGILATGHYPGRARTPDELRADLDQALALIPGRHRIALHAIYAEHGRRPADRDALDPRHFAGWMDWALERKLGLDFNGTFFAHPRH